MVEWAAWWDQTIDRWEGEGLPKSMDLETSLHYFDLDPLLLLRAAGRGPGCPSPVYHGGPIMHDAASYEALLPCLYNDSIIDAAIDHARGLKSKHDRGEVIIRLWLDGFFWFPRTLFGIEPHFYAF